MKDIGLVLEGGGMRGVYTAGVLEFFMEKQLYFPYVIGVSAGACNAASYISKQPGRNKKVTIDMVDHPRYLGIRNLWKEKSLFGMDFIFDEIPNQIVPFDFNTFQKSNQQFVIGTTDAITGEPVYFNKDKDVEVNTSIRASSSLPFISEPVTIKDKILFDGGIADPIPIGKAITDGYQRNVLVLTQHEGYRKKPFNMSWLAKKKYPNYRGLVQALVYRSTVYNKTLDTIKQLEESNRAFVIRPSQPLNIGRAEKNKQKLMEVYELGYRDAANTYGTMVEWMDIKSLVNQ